MWDSPNTISEELYFDDSIYNDATNLQNPAYSSADAGHTNYRWLIDAGIGNKVTLDWTNGNVASGNYVVFYDGKDVGDTRLSQIKYDPDLSNNSDVVSSGRYLYVYYVADSGGGSILNADLTFSAQ